MIVSETCAKGGGMTESKRVATVRDVAKLAGVSPGTVSKALNGVGQLSAGTRAKVLEAASALEFQPNHAARSLSSGRTFTVGVLTSDSFGRFTIPVMLGIEDSLAAGQVSTMLCDGRGDPVRENQLLERLIGRQVDGVVVTGRRRDPRPSLGKVGVPVVYVLSESLNPDDLSLTYDDEQGTELAAHHLLSTGRRHLAFVGGPERHLASRLRRFGVERALAAEGLELDPALAMYGQWSESWGRSAATIVARSGRAVDGIVCASDQIARGVLDGLRELDVQVPGDIAVVGFDNWDVMVQGARPLLTTVDPHLESLGREAATQLLAAIQGDQPLQGGIITRPCELVIRDSA